MAELVLAIPVLPALFFLFKIGQNTGRLVERLDSFDRRLVNIEKKLFH